MNSFSLSSKVAPVSLKSNRCESSRFAWSTALVSSWPSSSDTASNEGMVWSGNLRLSRLRRRGMLRETARCDLIEVRDAFSRAGGYPPDRQEQQLSLSGNQ